MSYYTPTKKQAAYINDLRQQGQRLVEKMHSLGNEKKEAGKPGAGVLMFKSTENLEKFMAMDECSVEGGDPSIWIGRVKYATQMAQVQYVRIGGEL